MCKHDGGLILADAGQSALKIGSIAAVIGKTYDANRGAGCWKSCRVVVENSYSCTLQRIPDFGLPIFDIVISNDGECRCVPRQPGEELGNCIRRNAPRTEEHHVHVIAQQQDGVGGLLADFRHDRFKSLEIARVAPDMGIADENEAQRPIESRPARQYQAIAPPHMRLCPIDPRNPARRLTAIDERNSNSELAD